MKAILEFDLSDSDDAMSHMRCVKSEDMALAIFQITSNTKKSIQWEVRDKNMSPNEAVDLVYERIGEILNKYAIDIDDLIR